MVSVHCIYSSVYLLTFSPLYTRSDVRLHASDVPPTPLPKKTNKKKKDPVESVIAHTNHSRHSPRWQDGQSGGSGCGGWDGGRKEGRFSHI